MHLQHYKSLPLIGVLHYYYIEEMLDKLEVQGYVFGPMETPNNWISTNAKPKMKNGVKKWVVSAADFQKAFPNIQMKQLPTNPSQYSDYYVVDNEGDLIAYSQSNIGSGSD